MSLCLAATHCMIVRPTYDPATRRQHYALLSVSPSRVRNFAYSSKESRSTFKLAAQGPREMCNRPRHLEAERSRSRGLVMLRAELNQGKAGPTTYILVTR